MPKITGYVKTFKVKDGDKDKRNNLSSRIDDERLFQKLKAIFTSIGDFKNIELNALPVFDERYIETKIRTYDDEVYTNFRGLNVPEKDKECESLTVTSIDSLILYFY